MTTKAKLTDKEIKDIVTRCRAAVNEFGARSAKLQDLEKWFTIFSKPYAKERESFDKLNKALEKVGH